MKFKQVFRAYMNDEIHLKPYQRIGIALLIAVLAGAIGWFWEFALAEFSNGFEHLYIKGGNLLPWMNIYAYGALIIIPLTFKLRKYPWAVFLTSTITLGLLELFAGWVVYTVGNGTRYWDYRGTFWGFGNINGFVCPTSAITFGLAALALMYGLFPWVLKLALTMKKRTFLTLTITLFAIIMLDDLTNLTLKNLGLPTAQDLYLKLGWTFKPTSK